MTIEQRIELLEKSVAELKQQKDSYYDPVEFQTAIQAINAGNKQPLYEYLKKGGRPSQ